MDINAIEAKITESLLFNQEAEEGNMNLKLSLFHEGSVFYHFKYKDMN